jgi:hypothetical protein
MWDFGRLVRVDDDMVLDAVLRRWRGKILIFFSNLRLNNSTLEWAASKLVFQ